jgi:hypothetical protein
MSFMPSFLRIPSPDLKSGVSLSFGREKAKSRMIISIYAKKAVCNILNSRFQIIQVKCSKLI